ncbi:MAG: ribosome silencing factor [Bacilli bacterium]|nr:ribosome silencing factor [Bacilli bacterium]
MKIENILKTLDHNLFYDVAIYDVREKTPLYDSVIIATSPSFPQMEAAIHYLEKEYTLRGVESGRDWTLIDLGDVIIHLFAPQERDKYALDQILSTYIIRKQN